MYHAQGEAAGLVNAIQPVAFRAAAIIASPAHTTEGSVTWRVPALSLIARVAACSTSQRRGRPPLAFRPRVPSGRRRKVSYSRFWHETQSRSRIMRAPDRRQRGHTGRSTSTAPATELIGRPAEAAPTGQATHAARPSHGRGRPSFSPVFAESQSFAHPGRESVMSRRSHRIISRVGANCTSARRQTAAVG